MLTFTTAMQMIEMAIAHREEGERKSWHLIWEDGGFVCKNGKPQIVSELVIARLTQMEVEDGLDSKGWNAIETKVRGLLVEDKIKCHE